MKRSGTPLSTLGWGLICVGLMMAGCAAPPPPAAPLLPNLQTVSADMINTLANSMGALAKTRHPAVLVDIRNRMTRRVDVKAINEGITARLVQTGKFRVVNGTEGDVVAEYVLTGTLRDDPRDVPGLREAGCKFTLDLADVRSGVVEWKDEQRARLDLQ